MALFGPRSNIGLKAKTSLPFSHGYDFIQPYECSTANEKNIRGINLNKLLLWMLPTAFWRNVSNGTFNNFQKGLLNAFAAHIASNGWIFTLTRNLIHFIN